MMAGAAALLAIYAALVYDIIAAINSSPQTTEINAKKRAPTLMKWVHIGLAQCAIFVGIGTWVAYHTPGTAWWAPLAGGILAGVLLYVQYVHAKNAGLASLEPGTEEY
jgi:hypothetical protein